MTAPAMDPTAPIMMMMMMAATENPPDALATTPTSGLPAPPAADPRMRPRGGDGGETMMGLHGAG